MSDSHSQPADDLEGQDPAQLEVEYAPVAPSSPASKITRTVAMIKFHALDARLDVESRIMQAGFEVVKERQMDFDTETDPDTLYELFGEDADSLAEGPVWVYVLERRRAVQAFLTLMGDRDPEVARQTAPDSLRALYGISAQQNAIMAAADDDMAELQIASLFASSPPMSVADLPSVGGSLRSVSSSVLSALRANGAPRTPRSSTSNGNGKALFRARPMPATMLTPDIAPRTTRAAALRAGTAEQKDTSPVGPRAPLSKDRQAQIYADVPGYNFRSERIQVASTAPPKVAPRMSRAASLRMGIKPEPAPVRGRPSSAGGRTSSVNGATGVNGALSKTFDGVPGHKRSGTITVASVKAPTVAPRLNKASALRAEKEKAPPSSFMFRTPSGASLSRSSSRESLHAPAPSISRPSSAAGSLHAPRPSISQRSTSAHGPRPSVSRSNSTNGISMAMSLSRSTGETHKRAASVAPAAPQERPKPKPRPSSLLPPAMAPRPNKAAMLRAAKMEADAAKNKPKSAAGKAKPAVRPLFV